MFIGREQELVKLNEMYANNKFEMGIVYGRRRVGKSEMIKHFCRGKKTIFFTASENSAENNMLNFFKAVSVIKAPARMDFDSILETLIEISKEEKIIIVIDEYPYLAKVVKYFSSLLQKYIDHNFQYMNCMIILCGSSMSFMERQVMGYKSPLYGRRTAQFKLEPFNYSDTAKFVSSYSNIDKAITYGVFGGTPYYLSRINENRSIGDNICSLFFQKEALLFEEPSNLIKQELREPMTYNAVITAIANGATKLSEIASKINKPSNLTETYLKNLISLGLCTKELPVGDKPSSRKGIYILKESMFKFWFRFVQGNLPLIYGGQNEKAYENAMQFINDYMGRAFESICIQYLWKNYLSLPIQPQAIGRWWGNNPIKREEQEIDVLAPAPDEKSVILGECKWQNEEVGQKVYKDLREKAEMFAGKEIYYYLFSKSGFTPALLEEALRDDRLKLVSLDDLFNM